MMPTVSKCLHHVAWRCRRTELRSCTEKKRPAKAGLFFLIEAFTSQALLVALMAFAIQPPALGSLAGSRLLARLGWMQGAFYELHHPLDGVGAVAFLGAVPLRLDDEHAFVREPRSRQGLEPKPHSRREAGALAEVPAQFHGARHLVDVLPTRARGAHEAQLELPGIERQTVAQDHPTLAAHSRASIWAMRAGSMS